MKVYYCITIPTKKKIKYLEEILKGRCTATIGSGQLERVMYDMYEINFIETKEEAEKIIENFRENKIYKPIFLDKEIWTDEPENETLIDPEAETTLYITMFDDETAIEYDCLRNRSILEFIGEFPDTEIKKK